MNKYLKILVVAGLLAYPVSIQADIVLIAPSATASSTVTAATLVIPTPKSAPGLIAPATVTTTTPTIPVVTPDAATKIVNITAYASVPDETSDHPFITASGATVADGIVAANFLPFGTKIQIPSLFGDKIFTVEDRTSQRFSGRVDIWMPTVAQAINFGIHSAEIVILDSAVAMK